MSSVNKRLDSSYAHKKPSAPESITHSAGLRLFGGYPMTSKQDKALKAQLNEQPYRAQPYFVKKGMSVLAKTSIDAPIHKDAVLVYLWKDVLRERADHQKEIEFYQKDTLAKMDLRYENELALKKEVLARAERAENNARSEQKLAYQRGYDSDKKQYISRIDKLTERAEKAEAQVLELREEARELMDNCLFFPACKEQANLCNGCKQDKQMLLERMAGETK